MRMSKKGFPISPSFKGKQPERMVCRYWVFDLDGTLTVPAHDFEGIRRGLGLPAGRPILEEIAKLPKAVASRAMEQLDQIEYEVARKAVPQPGAAHIVSELRARNCQVGVFAEQRAQRVGDLEAMRAGDAFSAK
jgi:phosphoglycolate phosphatase-like HAD superfamily hydrolase